MSLVFIADAHGQNARTQTLCLTDIFSLVFYFINYSGSDICGGKSSLVNCLNKGTCHCSAFILNDRALCLNELRANTNEFE